jgi:hypothetical protein
MARAGLTPAEMEVTVLQVQRSVRFVSVRYIAFAFALLAALLLASAAGYVIRGGTPSTVAVQQPVLHEQGPDAVTRNEELQQAKGFKGPDALERDQRILANR